MDARAVTSGRLGVMLRKARAASKARLHALKKGFAVDPERGTAQMLIRLAPGATPDALKRLGPSIHLGAQAGTIVTAELPLTLADRLSELPEVQHAALSRRAKPLLDVVRTNQMSGSDYLGVLSGPGDGTPTLGTWNGAGVVIGFVDLGIDFTHRDFINGSGTSATSRILYLWDQTRSGSAPSAYGYGAEYTQAQLTNYIRTGTSMASVDTDGHGTATAGCAAGNGAAANKYLGIAPAADIIEVQTDFSEAHIVDGVAYILQKAAALGKPAVINLSLGQSVGPHDGTDAIDQGIAALAGPGKIIVAAAGNDGQSHIHALISVPPGGSQTVAMLVPGQDQYAFMDLWHDPNDGYSVQVAGDSGAGSVSVASGGNIEDTLGATTIDIYDDDPSQPTGSGGAKEIYVQATNDSTYIQQSAFYVTLTRTASSGGGSIEGWTGPDSAVFQNGDNQHTIEEPADSPAVLAVGAYAARTTWPNASGGTSSSAFPAVLGGFAPFSSLGPTRDGRLKPNITAPGQNILTALSSFAPNPGATNLTPDQKHQSVNGTSFAAPITAGAVALLLQEHPTLTPTQVIAWFEGKARSDTKATGLPNNSWGYGKLVATPPAYPAPASFAAVAVSAGTIQWSWNGISNAEGYRLLNSGGGNVSGNLASTTFSYAQSGLGPNAPQTLSVQAYNAIGASTTGTLTRYTSAAVPASALFSNAGSGSALLSWSANGNPSGTPYEVIVSPTPDFSASVSTPVPFGSFTGTSQTLSLASTSTWYARVRARNGDGLASAFSAVATLSSSSTTPPPPSPPTPPTPGPTAPAAVSGLYGAALDAGTIQWIWSQTASATSYAVSRTGGSSLGTTTSASFADSGLGPNAAASITVQAVNAAGAGPATASGIVYTLAAAPGTPSLIAASTASLTVAWTANGNPSSTAYEVSYSADGFATAGTVAIPFGAGYVQTSATLTGLRPYTSYALRVRAQNHSGTAASYAQASLATVPTSTPQVINPAQAPSIAFGNVQLSVPPAAFTQTVNLTVALPASVPAPASAATALGPTGVAVDITTDKGLQPLKPLSLVMSYTDAQLAGKDPSRLVIARFDPASGLWIPLDSSPDPAHHRVAAALDHLSLYQVMSAVPASSVAGVTIFPNPVYSSRGQKMTFANLPAGATLDVFTLAGRKLRRLETDASGIAVWDARNDAGMPAASGVYFVLIEATGNTTVVKVMVER